MDASDADCGFCRQPLWLVVVALLLFGQAGLALQLFGTEHPWCALQDSRPILNGRHPLHQYHAMLGAASFREQYSTSCYDPSFQAGYPKTPIFDAGARPAEVVLTLVPGLHPATGYKLALWLCCVFAPASVLIASRGFGLSASGSCIAAVGACFIWWSPPVRALLESGHVDLLIAAQAMLVFLGGLARYARQPGVRGWLLLAGASLIGWTVHPLLCVGLLPLVALYYLITAPRHGLAWHLGFFSVPLAGVGPNLLWLKDWARFAWMRGAQADSMNAPLDWSAVLGSPSDYLKLVGPETGNWVVVGCALLGWLAMFLRGLRISAVLILGLGLAIVLMHRLHETWSAAKLLQFSAGEELLPVWGVMLCAYLVSQVLRGAKVLPLIILGLACLPALAGWFGWYAPMMGLGVRPFQMGLNVNQQQMVQTLQTSTTSEARILLEEPDTSKPGWNWTALLPTLTDRAYVGGLDPDAGLDHLFCGLKSDRLLGRPLAQWTAAERTAFCRTYNIGWVLCRSPESVRWWASDPAAKEMRRFQLDGEWVLFEIQRTRTYVLSGRATVEKVELNRIVLTDVVPNEAGEVVLSFHYQPELRVTPLLVELTQTPDPLDPVPLLKLRLPGQISRVTLSWNTP